MEQYIKQIQYTKGCPNNCPYCYEPIEMEYLDPIIPKDKRINILDMNFLANPMAKSKITNLKKGIEK